MGINLYDKTVLVTGGSGTLGKELKSTIPNGCFPTHKEFDICWPGKKLFQKLVSNEIDIVIHAAAIINDKINLDNEESMNNAYTTNVVGTANLTDACVRAKCSMYYISTDYVFDGTRAPYSEGATPNPRNFYEVTKLLGEMAVMLAKGYIVRTSFCGNEWLFPGAYTNVYSSRDKASVIADLIMQCIERSDRWHGTLHVGTKRKSFYELAKSLGGKNVKPFNVENSRDTSFDLKAMNAILGD